ncbi:MAG: ATP-binding protein [Verrucomicrobiota bacterium]
MELNEHPFFNNSDQDSVAELVGNADVAHFEDGEIIFLEGSPSDSLCLVLSGIVAFAAETPDNSRRIISTTKPGNFFGEIGIFTGAPRSLSAIAQGTVQIAKIYREDLLTFIKRTPGPIEQILGSIVNHLHQTTRHYLDDMLQQEKMSLVGTMVNSIIHDFKNPFTLIGLGAQLIQSRHKDDPKTIKICNNIEAQVERMVEMASELSEFSRGEQKLIIGKVKLNQLFDEFKELNEPFFDRDHLTIQIETDETVIEAEQNKLIRVLQNLVGNAIDALSEQPEGEIVVKTRTEGDTVVITIADNGQGIPEQIRDNFWTPFVTFGKSRGTGLGSAIAKSIIEAHNGSVTFETETGVGTTFTVTLPQKQPTEADTK